MRVEFSDGLIRKVLPRLREGKLALAWVAADAGELRGTNFASSTCGAYASARFDSAGVALPARYLVCDALQAFALLRNSDAVSMMAEPLIGNVETRDIVAIDDCALAPSTLELAMLARADTPLTPAAAFLAHCLTQTSIARA